MISGLPPQSGGEYSNSVFDVLVQPVVFEMELTNRPFCPIVDPNLTKGGDTFQVRETDGHDYTK
jgi:hypothetical protein